MPEGYVRWISSRCQYYYGFTAISFHLSDTSETNNGETGEDPSYFTAAFKHGSSHGGCNVNGPKVAKFLDG